MVEEGVKGAKLVEKLIEDPNKLLGAILIGNNIVNIGASSLATSIAVAKWGEGGVGIVTLGLTVIVLIFGEITPKSIAKQKSESVSLAVSKFINIVVKVLKPFIILFTGVASIFIRLLGGDPKANEPFITEEEIKTMVGVSEEEGVLEDVEKEKGIISEEIHMYEDRPGDVLFEKVRLNTLNSSPYRNSIIGTVKDIESITKEDLETCYYTFYNPSNMFIVVTGSFDPEEIMSLIRENQSKKNFKTEDNIKVKEFKEEDKVFKEKEIIKMNTNIPKIAYTLKIPLKDIKLTRRQLHLYMYILFTTLFDETSLFDEELKKDGIINNTTYVSLLNTNTHLLISLVNETNKYEEFLERLKDKLNNMEINEKDFKRKKKVLISNEIFAYENVENINDIIMDNIIYNNELEDDPIGIIKELNMETLLKLIKKIDISNASEVIVKK